MSTCCKEYMIMKKPKPLLIRISLFLLVLLIVIASVTALCFYWIWQKPNIRVTGEGPASLYIPTHATFNDVKSLLYEQDLIQNHWTFEWLAKQKNYTELVKPGRYLCLDRMNNNELINILRSGLQTPVQVIINNIRLPKDLAGKVSKQLEADSLSILSILSDTVVLVSFGFRPVNVLAMIIPNTYEFYWNTDADAFMKRMHREYLAFWNEERERKRVRTGFSRQEVSILASIIEKETLMNDEKARMAGVYINRLRSDWKLQADPTVVYANGDFTLKRVLRKHLSIDSPYNTYLYQGLPPGPICVPGIASIDAVLDYEVNDYYYFCAREDFSGYHNFARTYNQHLVNARKYLRALRERG